ncbi:MAG: nuclease domain-containing protein [Deltaproteobacteria bacterium]|nr:nuclease domain-containing protein [Deltaproteobacteria bacterium]
MNALDPQGRVRMAPCVSWVHEGKTLALRSTGATALVVDKFVHPLVDCDLFVWTVRERVGHIEIRGKSQANVLSEPLHIECVARRFSDANKQWEFVSAIVQTLSRGRLTVATTSSHTSWLSRGPRIAPTALVQSLMGAGESLRDGLGSIARRPLRTHASATSRVELSHESAALNLDQLAASDGAWDASPIASLKKRLRGRVPREIWGSVSVDTCDSDTHRMLRAGLEHVLSVCKNPHVVRIASSTNAASQRELRRTIEAIETALAEGPLADTSERPYDETRARQACVVRHDYASVLQWLDDVLVTPDGFSKEIRTAILTRDVATLYEWWVFESLARGLGAAIGVAPNALHFDHTRREVRLGEAHRLVYNHSTDGYSGALRPDFVLSEHGKNVAVFDAKLRVERAVGGAERAARVDLDKMHTYRDALGVACAVCVYPGSDSVIYAPDGSVQTSLRLAAIVRGRVSGVGAFALSPEALA